MPQKRPATKKPRERSANGKEWTIAVYMVGGPELAPSIERDLVELRRAGSNEQINVIVARQQDSAADAIWLEVGPRVGAAPAPLTKVGTSTRGHGKPRPLDLNLEEFLEALGTKYRAKQYLLVLWGHASGLGFGGLQPGSEGDQLRLDDLRKVLRTLKQARGGLNLDILGFCACAINKADYALELRDDVDFLVASQVGISMMMTWPFDQVVKRVLMSPTVEPASLADQLVQVFEEGYEPPPVAMTALNLQESENLGKRLDALSKVILTALERAGDLGQLNNLCVMQAFTEALDAYPWDVEPLIDLFDFCRKLVEQQNLEQPVRERARDILDKSFSSFVLNNARSGPKFGALNGLSLLAPDFEDPNWLDTCARCSQADARPYVWNQTKWALVTQRAYEFARARRDFDQ
jgi:hypothetical protein